jgi:hypothetical protein
MSKDRTDLIHRALRNLGVLPQGQSPSAEESQSVDDLIDPVIADLKDRNLLLFDIDPDFIDEEVFLRLAACVAAAAAPEFGQAQDQAIWALKQRAELDFKEVSVRNDIERHRREMKTDYYPGCRSWSYTTWSNS